MKSNIILILLVLLSIIGGVFIYHKISILEARYETLKESNVRLQLNKPLTDNQIKERQFKEEMYIRQQERDTTLILSFFGAFSIIVGLFTFRSVREEFVNKWKEISQANENTKAAIENKYIEIAHKYKVLENEINFELALAFSPRASDSLTKRQPLYLYYKLKAINKLVQILQEPLDQNAYIIDLVKTNLNLNIKMFSSFQNIEISPIELKEEMTILISFISEYLIKNDLEQYKIFAQGVLKVQYDQKKRSK